MKSLIKTETCLPATGFTDPIQSSANRITVEFNAPGSDSIRSVKSLDRGHYVLSRADGSITILTRSFRQVNRIDNGDGEVWDIHKHGERVISAVTDRTVKLYRFGEGCLSYTAEVIIKIKNPPAASAFAEGMFYILEKNTGIMRIYLFNEKNGIAVENTPLDPCSITGNLATRFSITGNILALRSDYVIELFDFRTFRKIFKVATKERDPYWALGSLDGKNYIAVADSGKVRLINYNTGSEKIVYDHTRHYPKELLFIENMLAIGAYCRLTILRISCGEVKNIFRENYIHNNNVTSFYYDTISRSLISAHDELAVTGPFDGISRIESDTIKSTSGQNAISLNMFDGRRIVFGDESGVPKLVDLKSLTVKKPLSPFHNFSEDWVHAVSALGSSYYACTCSGVRVLDPDFRETACFDFQDMRSLNIVTFNGGKYIIGSGIGNIRMFNTAGTRLLDIDICSFREIKNRQDQTLPFVDLRGGRIIAVTRSGKVLVFSVSMAGGRITASHPEIVQMPMPEDTSMVCNAQYREGLLYVGINGDIDSLQICTVPDMKMKATYSLDSSCSSIDFRGSRIYCGSGLGTLYEIHMKKIRAVLNTGGMKLREIKTTDDGRIIIACGDTLKICRFMDEGQPDLKCSIKFLPDNSVIFFRARPDGTVIFYNPEKDPFEDKNIMFKKNGIVLDKKKDREEILAYLRGIYGSYAVDHGIWGRDLIHDYLNLDTRNDPGTDTKIPGVLRLEHKKS